MTTRRGFFAGLAATALAPAATWADAGGPAYLAAARATDGSFALCGLTAAGAVLFRLPLPARGHAAAAHPVRPEAVAFARRPGTFAVVIDCRDGRVLARLSAAEGRNFQGHGAFSADGTLLLTAENDYAANRGVIGLRDATAGYVQIGEVASGGIGPHEILRLPVGGFAVANGGLSAHPDAGDGDFGVPEMRPNLAYLAADGTIDDIVELPSELRRNSIRHLAAKADGTVAFAMQWHGDPERPVPLAGLHRPGTEPHLLADTEAGQRLMRGYAGSIAFSGDGQQVALTSAPGGTVQVFSTETGSLADLRRAQDICGIAAGGAGFVATTGTGLVLGFGGSDRPWQAEGTGGWDNHLVPIPPA